MKIWMPLLSGLVAFYSAIPPAFADEIKYLLCKFRHGEIQIAINYSLGTANGATAMISDREIVWTPPGKGRQLAVINRYTGLMRISEDQNEHIGMCNAINPE